LAPDQKSRGQNQPPLKYCCCWHWLHSIPLAWLIFSVDPHQLTTCTGYPKLILGHGNTNEMWSGGYLLTNTYLPCNGGSHRRCCPKETSRPSNQRFFFCGEFSPLGNKRTGLMNLTKGILGILFFKSTYLEPKKARCRQI
jgi:hypothetical protein